MTDSALVALVWIFGPIIVLILKSIDERPSKLKMSNDEIKVMCKKILEKLK